MCKKMAGLMFLIIKSAISILPAFALIGGDSMNKEGRKGLNEPYFDTETHNITATAGTRATLYCKIENKGDYKVIWLNPRKTLISKDDVRFIDDSRISVERPKVEDWNLMIREVRYNDSGEYMCQINTKPVLIKRINLCINVPPEIIEEWTNSRLEVEEGSRVEMLCNATGVPPPVVTWYKHSESLTYISDYSGEQSLEGEVLVLPNISRYCDGVFECRADNGVEPSATKTFEVNVLFSPEVTLTTMRIGQRQGGETILSCTVAASPHGSMVWKKNGTEANSPRHKYVLEVYDEGQHKKTLNLNILNIEKRDYGEYTCEAANRLGQDSGTVVLYEYNNKPVEVTSRYPIRPLTTPRSIYLTNWSTPPRNLPSGQRGVDVPNSRANFRNAGQPFKMLVNFSYIFNLLPVCFLLARHSNLLLIWNDQI